MKYLWLDYRDWLINLCNFRKKGYDKLLTQLHFSPFEVVLERDINRVQDGLSFRQQFLSENGINGDFYDQPCSILEVLVALAVRIDGEYIGNPADPHPDQIFWEMICNLGLNKFDNKHYNSDFIYEILGKFVGRAYNFDGNGGIFPLKNVQNDQRKVEIWSQMMAYLNENYV